MTIAQVRALPSAETTEWRAYFELVAWEQQVAEQKAKQKGGGDF